MSTEASPVTGQVPSSEETTPLSASHAGTPQSAPQAGDSPPEMTLDQALKALADVRKESASRRVEARELAELRTFKSEAETAKLSDIQKAQAALDTANKRATTLQARLATQAVQQAATKLGIIDPEVAATLVQADLELDDQGVPLNAESALRALLKVKPYLASPALVAGSPANPPRGAQHTGVFKSSQLADPDFYRANKPAILKAMADGRIIQDQ